MLFALVTESGLVPRGNPDRLPSATATHWAKYSIAGMDRLVPGEWDGVHGGYDNSAALQNPNRVVPLDAVRALEREGMIGQLLDELFVTVGNLGSLNAMKRIGAEIANTLVQRGWAPSSCLPREEPALVAVLRSPRSVNASASPPC